MGAVVRALDQLLLKLIAVNGVPLPPEGYLNFLTSGSGPPVDNPNFEVDGEIVGSTDVPLVGGGGGGSAGPIDVTVTTAGGTSAASMPIGRAWKVIVKITTSFSAGTTASVGSASNHSAIGTGIDLTQAPGVYPYDTLSNWPTAAQVAVTLSGSPSVGAAEFLVFGGAVQS